MRAWLLAVAVWAGACSGAPSVHNDAAVPDARQLQCDEGFVAIEEVWECGLPCPLGPPAPGEWCSSCGPGTEPLYNGCVYGGCTASSGCNQPCPTPRAGAMSVCGWLQDLEVPGRDWLSSCGLRCDLIEADDDGACSLVVDVFDAADLRQNGAAAVPLVVEYSSINQCGNFVLKNIPAPPLSELVLRVSGGTPGSDWADIGVALHVGPNYKRDDVRVYAVRGELRRGWDVQIGEPIAPGGAVVEFFRHKGWPVENVDAGAEFYFADPGSGGFAILDPNRTATGLTGGSLRRTNGATSPAAGPELQGCVWPSERVTLIPGLILVQELDSLDSMGDPCE